MLLRVRPGVHSRKNASVQSHCCKSARGRNNSGASSCVIHFRTFSGALGFAHGSAWLTEIWPPFAKLVSAAGVAWRSTTVTS